jgi:hypothetical protein
MTYEADNKQQALVVNLVDSNISYALSYDDALESGRKSSKISYVKDKSVFNGISIFTDEKLKLVDTTYSKFKIAWLMEPRAYAPASYQLLESLIDKFDMVLTYDSKLLKQYPNVTKRIPASGIFLDSESIFIKSEKNKLCSMIYSEKTMLEGHRLRHVIAKLITDNFGAVGPVDMFGSGTGARLVKKSDALNHYMFSISVENSIDDFYITEKAFDCFATRTIPIYWGSNKIKTDFSLNPEGILIFNTLEELMSIVATISPELYDSRLSAIEENYQAVLKHYSVDDHIAEAISKLVE